MSICTIKCEYKVPHEVLSGAFCKVPQEGFVLYRHLRSKRFAMKSRNNTPNAIAISIYDIRIFSEVEMISKAQCYISSRVG